MSDSSSITLCTWNMQQNPDAWMRLEELGRTHGVQVALLQEAVPPPTGDWTTFPSATDSDLWAITAHSDRQRNFASVVAVLDSALTPTQVVPTALGQAEYGRFAVSHPGQFSVVEIGSHSGPTLTAVSLYGIWDRDERYLFSEATLHRAISDLTIVLQEKSRTHIVLAGDLNVFFDWDQATYDAHWAARYDTVFARLAAYGMNLVGPFGDGRLDGCECGRGDECRHVRTFAYQRKPENRLNQLDYVFATPSLRPLGCHALDDEASWRYSDHLPVIATFGFDA
jgi:hypothetical protein